MSDTTERVDLALEQFGTLGPHLPREALAPILATSGAALAARDPRFSDGLSKSIDYIRSPADGRVQALSLVWRLTSVTAMREHRRHLVEGLERGVPMFSELPAEMSDPDDRRHFGDAMARIGGEWTPAYLARAIAQERDGEKAREALTRALVAKVPNLSGQLGYLIEALEEVAFDQQDQGAGRARRVAAVIDALGQAAWAADQDVEPGDALGERLAKLTVDLLARRPAQDRNAALLAARAVIQFVILAVRLHGTLAANPQTYAFLSPLKRSIGTGGWPEELSDDLNRASAQLLEQLLFLVRLKMPDNELRRIYLSLVGDGVGKSRLARAAESSEIEPDLAFWLRTGSTRRVLPTQNAVAETAVSAIDRDLGLAFREADILRASVTALASEAISAAEFHSSRLGEELKELFGRLDRLSGHIEAAARRRNLFLKGAPGEVVTFSPMEYEPEPSAVGARTVRIKTRTVERIIDGQSVGIIVKGDVEGA